MIIFSYEIGTSKTDRLNFKNLESSSISIENPFSFKSIFLKNSVYTSEIL